MRRVLVTGGAGYIGSHAVLALLNKGYSVTALDNFCNSSRESLARVSDLCGCPVEVVEGDVRDASLLDTLFARSAYTAVLHFAGLKAVAESVQRPLLYYENNVAGSINLLEAMSRAGVFQIVFSSSATVYGNPRVVPVPENHAVTVQANPYARSKRIVEQILADLVTADPRWRIAILRYFNPAGAHESGRIGEDPSGIPNNLVPYLLQVAIGRHDALRIFGSDYDTPDGTGVRDYIHIMDLVEGHLCALLALAEKTGLNIWNLGTGVGTSVLEVVRAFEQVTGRNVKCEYAGRRQGDVAQYWADPRLAQKELGWRASRGLSDIVADAWRWQLANPNGYMIEAAQLENNK